MDGTLYFAGPAQLNDMLETKFDHAEQRAFAEVFRKTLSEISQARGGPVFDFDGDPPVSLLVAHDTENERFRLACDKIGIFSAARRPNDQAMWAYYGEDAKGVCFELEWSPAVLQSNQLFPVDVTYSDRARLYNRADDWRLLFIALAEEHPAASISELQELSLGEDFRRRLGILSTARVASVKHADWAHEKEIRLLSPSAGAKPVLASVLKRAHFIRTDGEQWGPIMQELRVNYPAVEVVHWKVDHGMVAMSPRRMEFRSIPVS